MKRFFNWILVLGACVAAFYLIGLIVPRSQTQGSRTNLSASPTDVIELVKDPQHWRAWHPDVSTVKPRGERNGRPVWLVTDPLGRSFELEVLVQEDYSWQGSYELDGTRFTLAFLVVGFGQGTRLQATRTADTRDVWMRAKRFLWSKPEASPVALLNGIAGYFGEQGDAVSN